jgi:hypothetical protein
MQRDADGFLPEERRAFLNTSPIIEVYRLEERRARRNCIAWVILVTMGVWWLFFDLALPPIVIEALASQGLR